MTPEVIFAVAVVIGVYMAWNIGANNVANAMGTSVGSGALTLRNAVIVAAIFELSGAVLAGGEVTETIKKGIIDQSLLGNDPKVMMVGMTAALLAAAAWLHLATYFSLPVSTSHSIVGAVIGFGLVAGGVDAVMWPKLGAIALSWIISP